MSYLPQTSPAAVTFQRVISPSLADVADSEFTTPVTGKRMTASDTADVTAL